MIKPPHFAAVLKRKLGRIYTVAHSRKVLMRPFFAQLCFRKFAQICVSTLIAAYFRTLSECPVCRIQKYPDFCVTAKDRVWARAQQCGNMPGKQHCSILRKAGLCTVQPPQSLPHTCTTTRPSPNRIFVYMRWSSKLQECECGWCRHNCAKICKQLSVLILARLRSSPVCAAQKIALFRQRITVTYRYATRPPQLWEADTLPGTSGMPCVHRLPRPRVCQIEISGRNFALRHNCPFLWLPNYSDVIGCVKHGVDLQDHRGTWRGENGVAKQTRVSLCGGHPRGNMCLQQGRYPAASFPADSPLLHCRFPSASLLLPRCFCSAYSWSCG